MHLNEIDFRSTPLRTLCTTATNAIDELVEYSKAGMFDGFTALEYASYLQGAVLVACQAYSVGTVSDINKIRGSSNEEPLEKLVLYKAKESPEIEYTYVELINSLANYFKHNEEWSSWPRNRTTRILEYHGIVESTEFPMNTGIAKIIGESGDLRGLCEVLEVWREGVVQKYAVYE
ncbi:hypothetical protein ACFL0R_04680 [Pseudomonadota bacterium]